ncbi:MAG: hypothetical protein ABSH13_17155 [Candidatus Acidiferrum sp.]
MFATADLVSGMKTLSLEREYEARRAGLQVELERQAARIMTSPVRK